MIIDLADIARGRRITALAARDLNLSVRHTRPSDFKQFSRLFRLFGF